MTEIKIVNQDDIRDEEIPDWKIEELMRNEEYQRIVETKEILIRLNIEDEELPKMRLVANLD